MRCYSPTTMQNKSQPIKYIRRTSTKTCKQMNSIESFCRYITLIFLLRFSDSLAVSHIRSDSIHVELYKRTKKNNKHRRKNSSVSEIRRRENDKSRSTQEAKNKLEKVYVCVCVCVCIEESGILRGLSLRDGDIRSDLTGLHASLSLQGGKESGEKTTRPKYSILVRCSTVKDKNHAANSEYILIVSTEKEFVGGIWLL
jgi:hypothetical protein